MQRKQTSRIFADYKIHNFGTDNESMEGPLEDLLLEGESAEVHADHA